MVFDSLTEEDWEVQRERLELEISVPQVRAALAEKILDDPNGLGAGGRARRPSTEDFAVRTWAGAVIGAAMSVMLPAGPTADWVPLMDAAFEHWRPDCRSDPPRHLRSRF